MQSKGHSKQQTATANSKQQTDLPPRVSKGRSKLFWQIERGTKGRTASVAVLVDSAPWVVVKTIFILEDPSFENPYLYWRIPVLKIHIYTGGSQFVGHPPGEPIWSTYW